MGTPYLTENPRPGKKAPFLRVLKEPLILARPQVQRWGLRSDPLLLTLLFVLCSCTCVRAQSAPPTGQVSVISSTQPDSVQLRWAPSSPDAWRHLISHGVFIDRYSVRQNGKMLPLAQRSVPTRLTPSPLTPATLEEFGRNAKDNNVAIAGQAIYGERMKVSASTGGIQELVERGQEEENRFSFSLFSADQSWLAAKLMGLAYADKTADPAKTYLYRIVPAKPLASLDTTRFGFTVVDAGDVFLPPKLTNLEGSFEDRSATISWPLTFAAEYYTGYAIGRSTDGVSFERVNELSFVPLRNERAKDRAFFTDSLPENNRPYFYAVAGITPFGQVGDYSDPVQGMGRDAVPGAVPDIKGLVPDTEGGMRVQWAFPAELEKDIQYFRVRRADNDAGPYVQISDDLPTALRFFTDSMPLPSNYYVVTAYDNYTRPLSSLPRLGMPEDSIPPPVPANVRGVITKQGDVVVTWDPLDTPDLLGYRLYLSNDSTAEFSLASNAPETMNFYKGETTLRSLSGELFVKVISLDLRENASDFSPVTALTRPDTIPPSPPSLVKYTANTEAVSLHWRASSSGDVREHTLYRRLRYGDTTWVVVPEFSAGATSGVFIDATVPAGIPADYRLEATDQAGLQGNSEVMCAARILGRSQATFEKLTGVADRTQKAVVLAWRFAEPGRRINYFEVYRSIGDASPRKVGTISATAAVVITNSKKDNDRFTFTDIGPLRMNTDYTYHLRAAFADGSNSRKSELITVNY